MTRNEIKTAIENNYKIVMAAIKVNEAYDALVAAEKAHDEIKYDWTHQTSNEEWLRRLEVKNRVEGNLKKAVNAFFKLVGQPTKKWELGLDAKYAFNDYLRHAYFHDDGPIAEIQLCDLYCL